MVDPKDWDPITPADASSEWIGFDIGESRGAPGGDGLARVNKTTGEIQLKTSESPLGWINLDKLQGSGDPRTAADEHYIRSAAQAARGGGQQRPKPTGGALQNQPATSAPATPAAPPAAPVTQDMYDWYRINEALRAAQMDGWQIAGASHVPVNQGKWIKNTNYQAPPAGSTPDEIAEWDRTINQGQSEYSLQESNEYVIGVINPTTGQMLRLTLSRGPRDPVTQGYAYSVTGRQDQGKIDQANPGHTGITRLPFSDGHEELWGTNSQTGAYEKLPDQPAGLGNDPKLKGWNDIRQIEKDGNLFWVGTPPGGGEPQQIVSLGIIKADKYVPGSIRQVTRNGQKVYVGTNKQTQQIEVIPEYGQEPAVPATVSGPSGRVIYQPDANGQLRPAPGVAQPVEGVSTRWVDAGGGRAKQQTFRNGDWSDDPDVPQKDVSPELIRATGAIRPKGQKYWQPSADGRRLVWVEADGNGGYTIPDDTTSKPFPGLPQERPVTPTTGEQEFITRYNPETQQQENVKNPNWTPTATGDRVRQLREIAAAKQQELSAKIGKNGYTAEQAQKDFDAYWDTQVEPRRQQLQFDQEQERRKAERDQAATNISALSTAQTAGQNAVSNYMNQQKYMVGPGFAQQAKEMSSAIQGGRIPSINPEAYMYKGYDYNDLAQYYTAQALQHISPTAAAMLGTQPGALQATQGMDLNTMLNRTQFQPQAQAGQPVTININSGSQTGGGAPAAPAAPAAAPAANPYVTALGDLPFRYPSISGPGVPPPLV